jgi:hypothetical protein
MLTSPALFFKFIFEEFAKLTNEHQRPDESKTQEVGYIGQHDHGAENAADVHDRSSKSQAKQR